MTADHTHHARRGVSDAIYHMRLARDAGEVPVDVASILLASLAETDDALARYEDE